MVKEHPELSGNVIKPVDLIDYNTWVEGYLQNSGLNILALLFEGVCNQEYKRINIKEMFDRSREVPQMKADLYRHLTFLYSAGVDPIPFLKIFCSNAVKVGYL